MDCDPKVEALARHLCEQDGNNPDRLVNRYPAIEYARGIARAYQYIPTEDTAIPMWQVYLNLAACAIQFLRDGIVTETQIRLAEPCQHEWCLSPIDLSHKCLKCGATVSEYTLQTRGRAA